MNSLDFLTTSPPYYYSKFMGTRKENFYFDLRGERVNELQFDNRLVTFTFLPINTQLKD